MNKFFNMDEVMNELKESIQEVETYLKHLKDTYAEWIQRIYK